MLIRSQNGGRLVRAHSVMIGHYNPTGMYALLAADGIDTEGVILGIYSAKAEAEAALDYIIAQAAHGKAADLRHESEEPR